MTKDTWNKFEDADVYRNDPDKIVFISTGDKIFLGNLWAHSCCTDSKDWKWQDVELPEVPQQKPHRHQQGEFCCFETEENGEIKLMLRYKRSKKLAYVEVKCCPFTGYTRS